VTFRLPPTALGVTPGDVVRLTAGPAGRFLITDITDGLVREVEAQAIAAGDNGAPTLGEGGGEPVNGPGPSDAFAPEIVLLDLPVLGSGSAQDFARAAAYAKPWRAMVLSSSEGLEGFRPRARLDRPARIGRLVEPLAPGPVGLFDLSNVIVLDLPGGELASADMVSVLNGANRIAVRGGNGAWEVIGFQQASEIAPARWRLSGLLRALHGTEDAMISGHSSDAQAVVLDETVRPLGLDVEEVGRLANWIVDAVGASQGQAGPYAFAGGERALTPLAPVHLLGERGSDGAARFTWTGGSIRTPGLRRRSRSTSRTRPIASISSPVPRWCGASR